MDPFNTPIQCRQFLNKEVKEYWLESEQNQIIEKVDSSIPCHLVYKLMRKTIQKIHIQLLRQFIQRFCNN